MLYILIVAGIFVLELIIKRHIEQKMPTGESKEILGGRITLKKQYNRGMFLNFMQDKALQVKRITCFMLGILLLVFVFLLPRKHNKLLKLGLSISLGGAISNVYDRMKRGYVVDYFSINCKGLKSVVFNLSDIAIIIGSIMILFASGLSSKGKDISNKK